MPVLASDRVNSSVGSVPASAHVQTFAAGDWPAAVGGYRTMTVAAATHGRTSVANVVLYELAAGELVLVAPHDVTVTPAGDVEIRVTEGAQFDGQAHIL